VSPGWNTLRRMARHGLTPVVRDAFKQRAWRRRQAARERYLTELGRTGRPFPTFDPALPPADSDRFWRDDFGRTGLEFLTHLSRRPRPLFYTPDERARRVERLKRECPSDANACIETAHRLAAGDFSDFVAAAANLGAEVNWLAHIDAPGCWPAVGLSDYLHLDRAELPADPRLTWELNRLQHLPLLAAAWLLSGERAHLDTLQRHLDSWMAQNPVGIGPNWLQAQENALRALALSFTYALCADAPHFDDAFRLRWLALIQALAATAAATLSDTPLTHNHLVTESAALWALGLLFPELRGAQGWRKSGERLLLREIRKQIHPSGVHGEQALAYHFFVLESLAVVASTQTRLGLDVHPVVAEALARMAQAGERLLRSDGACWRIGDNDDGHVLRVPGAITQSRSGWLALAKVLSGQASSDAFAEYVWLGPTHRTASPTDKPPSPVLVAFEDAGLVSLNAHGTRLLFRAGPVRWQPGVAPNHLHADFLSLVVEQDGIVLLDDPGVFRYNPDFETRVAMRRTRAHSAPCVDGGDCLDVTRQRFGVGERPQVELLRADWDGAHAHLAARHNGYNGAFLRRDLLITPGRFIWILDRYDSTNTHELAAVFVTPFDGDPDGRRVALSQRQALSVLWPGGASVERETAADIWLAPRYGVRESASRFKTRTSGSGPLALAHLLTLDPAVSQDGASLIQETNGWRLRVNGVTVRLADERAEWDDKPHNSPDGPDHD
jgi:hypothetical protein